MYVVGKGGLSGNQSYNLDSNHVLLYHLSCTPPSCTLLISQEVVLPLISWHIKLCRWCVRASNHSESSLLMTLQAGQWSSVLPPETAVAWEKR